MSIPGGYRRHSLEFKLRVCSDIRSGKLGRREAQRAWRLSPKLVHVWLGRYDRGELVAAPVRNGVDDRSVR